MNQEKYIGMDVHDATISALTVALGSFAEPLQLSRNCRTQ